MTASSPADQAPGQDAFSSTSVDYQRTATYRSEGNSIRSEREYSQSTREPTINAETEAQNEPNRRTRYFGVGGKLRPFRLLRQDIINIKGRYVSDWQVFNQQVIASAVYIFFTNILPGITFASDLYTLTGKSWGTIEVVFSTGLCGLIFSL